MKNWFKAKNWENLAIKLLKVDKSQNRNLPDLRNLERIWKEIVPNWLFENYRILFSLDSSGNTHVFI